MVFSGLTFLLLFLPSLLLLYYLSRDLRWRNGVLVIFSLVFYAWGEPVMVLLLVATTLFNYLVARVMARTEAPATVFTILSEIALIPGGSLYITMHHLVGGRQAEALQYGMHTGMVAIAIALGIVLVTAFTTSFFSRKKRPATKHKH